MYTEMDASYAAKAQAAQQDALSRMAASQSQATLGYASAAVDQSPLTARIMDRLEMALAISNQIAGTAHQTADRLFGSVPTPAQQAQTGALKGPESFEQAVDTRLDRLISSLQDASQGVSRISRI